MKIVFLSNYFNHHQRFMSDALSELSDDGYAFVETEPMDEERQKLGWGLEAYPDYVVQSVKDQNQREFTESLVNDADVVIIGSAPESYICSRLQQKKLTFRYSERIYKSKYKWYKWPFRLFTFYKRYGRHKNTYMLCASAYTAADYAKHFTFLKKTYKWGYFPETKKYEDIETLVRTKEKNSILWCGRFLDWKHPDDAIKALKRLKDEGYHFQFNMIGRGELQEKLEHMIRDYDMQDCVHLLGSMPPESVRDYMERSAIYLFTSDRGEGWGAVLNESMNSGCAVVAGHAIGAVPFLIKDRENGLVYKSESVDMLYKRIKYLLDHPEEQERIGTNAYQTITELWNSDVAAKRFLKLVEEIKDHGYCDLYEDGPCSRAPLLKNNWFKESDEE